MAEWGQREKLKKKAWEALDTAWSCEHQVKKAGEEELLQVPKQRFNCSTWRGPCWGRYLPCSLWRTPHWSRQIFPEGTGACGQPMLEQGEMREEEGAAERSNYRLTPNPHSPSSCSTQGRRGGRGVRSEGVKLSLEKGGEEVMFSFLSLFPTTRIYLNRQ